MRCMTAMFCSLALAAACQHAPAAPENLLEFEPISSEGNVVDFASLTENAATTFVFLAPDCPLSQSYTLTLKQLAAKFDENGVEFMGIVPGLFFDRDEIDDFIETYALTFPVLIDREFTLTEFFDARITPEAFVVDAEGALLYRGAIDNWATALGQHRSVITEKYLDGVLADVVSGVQVEFVEIPAIGCFIEGRVG